jgi:hypothetical protein
MECRLHGCFPFLKTTPQPWRKKYTTEHALQLHYQKIEAGI